jgi:hypothetical protein
MKIKIMKGTSTFPLAERKMLEYIATQTQVLQVMAQTISPLKSKLHSIKTTIPSPMVTIKTWLLHHLIK